MAKKKRSFAWSPLRALMKRQGANIVAREAVNVLIADLEDTAMAITKQALKFAGHAKRKKITKEDVQLALKYMKA
ncbi:MAG: hypothetical protein Kow0069_22590 [Promethearchaeota archaeon]